MDLTPYEGKKVRLTVVYEGTLTHRSLRAPEYVITGEDGHTLYVNPDHVTDVKLVEPEWWPPLPGDVLHFGNDPTDLVYTVTRDGDSLIANSNYQPATLFALSAIQPGGRLVHDPDNWTLLHKGARRQAKEGK